ncbi:MAG: hypothetical protein M0R22_01770 [Dehalococcoidia bacterium]|jgi:UDP-4-amino-4-deoxy-L-arabinose formyltransferase/UDP-glucuronic acid dehydrogenase (UDP-4-keto-hexauronic acid decarboxylating)|nr:hypothetical protein [Dehalococcoidia bacterium]
MHGLDERGAEWILGQRPDVVLSAFNPIVFPSWFLQACHADCLNVHPSLLPQYAGTSPYFWPVFDGEERAGVTVHRIVQRLDAGDVVLQEAVALPPCCTYEDIVDLPASTASNVVHRLLTGISPSQLDSFPQDLSQRSYRRPPSAIDLAIQWGAGTEGIARLLRACHGSPWKPLARLRGRDWTVWGLRLERCRENTRDAEVGRVHTVGPDGLQVTCSDGMATITAAQLGPGPVLPANLLAQFTHVHEEQRVEER